MNAYLGSYPIHCEISFHRIHWHDRRDTNELRSGANELAAKNDEEKTGGVRCVCVCVACVVCVCCVCVCCICCVCVLRVWWGLSRYLDFALQHDENVLGIISLLVDEVVLLHDPLLQGLMEAEDLRIGPAIRKRVLSVHLHQVRVVLVEVGPEILCKEIPANPGENAGAVANSRVDPLVLAIVAHQLHIAEKLFLLHLIDEVTVRVVQENLLDRPIVLDVIHQIVDARAGFVNLGYVAQISANMLHSKQWRL